MIENLVDEETANLDEVIEEINDAVDDALEEVADGVLGDETADDNIGGWWDSTAEDEKYGPDHNNGTYNGTYDHDKDDYEKPHYDKPMNHTDDGKYDDDKYDDGKYGEDKYEDKYPYASSAVAMAMSFTTFLFALLK